ncbi:BLUF domain-containing protein [Mesonia aquimarina]|uniref:BLUF domain-containing protein n=1 Tax=Mesonia aquimarina TaxID=1504967 RepID=UPI000EF58D6F|nr:BLUF domain-containing protein [Mesonia aquimarina]
MHKAICYVSTASPGIAKEEVENLLVKSQLKNNDAGITGLLLYSGGNFLQIIEGSENLIDQLYKKIRLDRRHFNLIQIFERTASKDSYKKYESDFISENMNFNSHKIQHYIEHLQMLDSETRQAVKNILASFIKL